MKSIVNKPWGSFEVINEGKKYTMKKIIVTSGGQLSLQSHEHRSEHWLIAEGGAEVVINENTYHLNVTSKLNLENYHLTARYQNETPENILQSIKVIYSLDYVIDGNNVTIKK